MKFLEDFWMGSENLKGIWMGYEFFGEKIIFPSPRSQVLIMTSPKTNKITSRHNSLIC